MAAAKPETEETTAADDTKLSNLPGAVERQKQNLDLNVLEY